MLNAQGPRHTVTITEKSSSVLPSFKACFKVLTTKNEPVANIINDNVKLDVLLYIPDNFQGVAEMIFGRLPKSPSVLTCLK